MKTLSILSVLLIVALLVTTCAAPDTAPSSPMGGSSGSGNTGSGNAGSGSKLGASIDCQCSKTGSFVTAVAPEVTSGKSKDGKYRVEESSYGVFVTRVSDNKKMLHLDTIAKIKRYGFGPNSRSFVLVTSNSATDPTTVTLWDLESGDRLLMISLSSSGGWGFSPDGRTFLIDNKQGGQLYLTLMNTESRKTRLLNWVMPYWAGWSFSPCGDVVATAVAPESKGRTNIMLYRTYDLTNYMSNPADITGFWPGLKTTSQYHQTSQTPPLNLAPNKAGQKCS